jgi:aminoglycoside phosphotransferase
MKVEEIRKLLPKDLAETVSGYRWQQVFTGRSASHVFQLDSPQNRLYLKVDSRAIGPPLHQEKLKIEWLQGQLPVPQVRMFTEDESRDYLLLSAIPGVTACDESCKSDVPSTLMQLVTGLKMIHSVPIDNCPFDASLRFKIELARRNLRRGVGQEFI